MERKKRELILSIAQISGGAGRCAWREREGELLYQGITTEILQGIRAKERKRTRKTKEMNN
jgi:hypothetical protein